MTRCLGLTELVWASLPEDNRLAWRYFSRFVAFVGVFFVTKTGNLYFDLTLGAFTTAFLVISIETQRSYSRLSSKVRKRSARVAITIGSWGIVTIGLAIFLQAGISAAATVFSSDIVPMLGGSQSVATKILLLSSFMVAVPMAMVRVFRQLRLWELCYQLPRAGLKRLLIHKEPKAISFSQFAYMELSALIICLVYASSAAEMANVFIRVGQLVG